MSSTADLDTTRVRAGKNQSLFREVNERIQELSARNPSVFEELHSSRTILFACECMDETCTEQVTMTIGEYELVRADSNSFFVLAGHDVPDVEEIVREEPAYVVVSKLGVGAAVAEKLDPRKRAR
jgi:hypothetical protein